MICCAMMFGVQVLTGGVDVFPGLLERVQFLLCDLQLFVNGTDLLTEREVFILKQDM